MSQPMISANSTSALAACLLLAITTSCSNARGDLGARLGVAHLPHEVQVAAYYSSGIGMDHHYLWQLAPLSQTSFAELTGSVGAKPVSSRATSGCLGLEKSDAPSWWPSADLEDALWDYAESPYALYTRQLPFSAQLCIFRDSNRLITFVQVFET
jgi:hypothetical protein